MARNGAVNVIVFTDTFLETSGVGTYYRTLLNWCRTRDDVRLTVVCPEPVGVDGCETTDQVIPVRPKMRCELPVYREYTVGYYPQSILRDLVRGINRPKVVHIATSGPLGVAGAKVARKVGVPLVGCYHTDMRTRGRIYGRALLGRPGEWLGERATRYLDRRTYGRCTAMCVPSASAHETTRAFFSGKTELIANPVDVDRFRPGSSRDGWFRSRYLRKGRVLAAVVGRTAKEKNLDRICELLAHDERIDLVFVGDGPASSEIRQRWGVAVTGFLHGQELVDAYQQADVFVQMSLTETFGLCLAEALACGLPAVVLRGPGLAENLPAGSGVEILEQEELPSLGDRCAALVSDPRRHRAYSREARRFALKCAADGVLPRWVRFHEAFAR